MELLILDTGDMQFEDLLVPDELTVEVAELPMVLIGEEETNAGTIVTWDVVANEDSQHVLTQIEQYYDELYDNEPQVGYQLILPVEDEDGYLVRDTVEDEDGNEEFVYLQTPDVFQIQIEGLDEREGLELEELVAQSNGI